MRLERWLTSALATALLASSTAVTASAMTADEEKIKVAELPKSVLKAAKKAFPKAKVVGAAKEAEDGETIYEVMLKQKGKTIDLGINDEGEIQVVEKEIDVEDLPKAVTRAAAKKFPKGKITKVEEVTDEDDVVVYEVAFKIGDEESFEVVMAPNGKILESGADEKDEDEDADKAKKKDKDDEKEAKVKKEDQDEDDDEDDMKKDKDDDKKEAKGAKKDKDDKKEAKSKKNDKDDDDDDDSDDDDKGDKKDSEKEKKTKDG